MLTTEIAAQCRKCCDLMTLDAEVLLSTRFADAVQRRGENKPRYLRLFPHRRLLWRHRWTADAVLIHYPERCGGSCRLLDGFMPYETQQPESVRSSPPTPTLTPLAS